MKVNLIPTGETDKREKEKPIAHTMILGIMDGRRKKLEWQF